MNHNRTYIFLTLIFIGLSVAGLIYFFNPPTSKYNPDLLNDLYPTPTTPVEVTPIPTDLSAEVPTKVDIPEPTPTSTTTTLNSDKYGFKALYSSSRQLYETAELDGTRFTLYSTIGNITVHVGTKWSWSHPGRKFTSDLLVSGQPTFVYQIPTQTIVDFTLANNHFTIQCVHGGRESSVQECQQFFTNFTLTTGS